MDRIGTLMTRMVSYWTTHLPHTSLELLRTGRFGDRLLEIARSDLELVHGMGTNEAQRNNLWSDMMSSGQLNIFPTQTEKADPETVKKVKFLLKTAGAVVDKALEKANMGYDWTPDTPTEYSRG